MVIVLIVELLADPARTFAFMACMAMIYQFLEDLKTMKVDCKKNWLMTGATIALFFVSKNTWWFVLLLIVFSLSKRFFSKIMADGDIEILQWLAPGTFLFGGLNYVLAFTAFLCFLLIGWNVFVLKNKSNAENRVQGTVFLAIALLLIVYMRFFAT